MTHPGGAPGHGGTAAIGTPVGGTAPGGVTAADPEVLRQIGSGLVEMSNHLGDAVHAVDAIPLESVGLVLGPVGGEFAAALLAATARHREVLAALVEVTGAAGALVRETGALYAGVDDDLAADVRAVHGGDAHSGAVHGGATAGRMREG